LPAPATTTTDDAPAWYVPLARAVPALVLALVITFSPDHSSALGLVSLGVFGIVAGASLAAFGFRSAKGVTRTITLAQGLVTIAAGIAAIVAPGGGLPYFVFVLTAFAAITGFLELYLGLRSRGRSRVSRDWVFAGALTAVLALVVLLLPPDFSQVFTGPDGVTRELTASVIAVGALGAYWAILGVYLVIAGLSLKWQTSPVTANGA
jgi:uncharacterized membrane protein HdeD (DUF308 family)